MSPSVAECIILLSAMQVEIYHMTFLWIAELSATHIRPNKTFSGLIQPIPHAFPMDEGNRSARRQIIDD